MLTPFQEKLDQAKKKNQTNKTHQTKPRCWKILWPATVRTREGSVHSGAAILLHMKQHLGPHSFFSHQCSPLLTDTHGLSSFQWILLLTPDCFNCFRVQKKKNHQEVLIGTCYTPWRRRELSCRTAPPVYNWLNKPAEHGVLCNNCCSHMRKEPGLQRANKNCFLIISFPPLLWTHGKSLTAAPKLWQFVVFIVSSWLC